MWNTPSKTRLAKMPALYATEKTPSEEKIMRLHFFIGATDWYACEYSPEERIFFGFTILNGDIHNAEWGYFSLDELESIVVQGWCQIDCEKDFCFKPQKAIEIAKIRECMGWEDPKEPTVSPADQAAMAEFDTYEPKYAPLGAPLQERRLSEPSAPPAEQVDEPEPTTASPFASLQNIKR